MTGLTEARVVCRHWTGEHEILRMPGGTYVKRFSDGVCHPMTVADVSELLASRDPEYVDWDLGDWRGGAA